MNLICTLTEILGVNVADVKKGQIKTIKRKQTGIVIRDSCKTDATQARADRSDKDDDGGRGGSHDGSGKRKGTGTDTGGSGHTGFKGKQVVNQSESVSKKARTLHVLDTASILYRNKL